MFIKVNATTTATAVNLSNGIIPKRLSRGRIFVICKKLIKNEPKPTAYKLPAIICASHAIHPLIKALGRRNPSLTHKYPPPASGIAEPNSA